MRRFIWPLLIVGGLAVMGRSLRRWFLTCTVLFLGFLFAIERHEVDPVTGGGRYSMTLLSWLLLGAFLVALCSWPFMVRADRRRQLPQGEVIDTRYLARVAPPLPAEAPSVQDLGEVPLVDQKADVETDAGSSERPSPIWIPTPAAVRRSRPQSVEQADSGLVIRDHRSVDPDEL